MQQIEKKEKEQSLRNEGPAPKGDSTLQRISQRYKRKLLSGLRYSLFTSSMHDRGPALKYVIYSIVMGSPRVALNAAEKEAQSRENATRAKTLVLFHAHTRYSLQKKNKGTGSQAICHQVETRYTPARFSGLKDLVGLTMCVFDSISFHHVIIRATRIYILLAFLLLLTRAWQTLAKSRYITCNSKGKQQGEPRPSLALSVYMKRNDYE